MSYKFKTEPFKHQAEEHEETKDLEDFGFRWEQGCVDSETEYLTMSGWRGIDRFKGGHVAQWHPDTNSISFVEPKEYVKKPCPEMYILKDRNRLNQMLSPEHRVPFYRDNYDDHDDAEEVMLMYEIDEMLNEDKDMAIYLPSECSIPLRGGGMGMTEEWLRVMVTLGVKSFIPRGSKSNLLEMTLYGDELERFRPMVACVGEVKIVKTFPNKKNIRIQLSGRKPDFWKSMWTKINDSDRDIILSELEYWSRKHQKVFVKNPDIKDFFQFVAVSAGKKAQIMKQGDGGWFLKIRNAGHEKLTWRNFGKVPSTDGFKYCFRVPTQFLIFRRHDVIFLSGNTGKSKIIIDGFGHNFVEKRVDGMLVIAPPGVERNWVTDEFPAHLPDDISDRAVIEFYQTNKAGTVWHKNKMRDLLRHKGPVILAMSYEAMQTKLGKAMHWAMLDKRKIFYALDEAQKISNPDTARTASVVASGKFAPIRRIGSGTLGTEGPIGVYEPINFLDPYFWYSKGLGSFATFKNYFANWEKRRVPIAGRLTKAGKQMFIHFDACTGVRNIDELNEYLKEKTSRVLKDVLDLPPKLYSKLYFDMNAEQERAYRELKEDYCTEIGDAFIDAEMAVVRLMRMQQVTCGYLHEAADEPKILLGKTNPRLEAVLEYCSTLTHSVIIWARFSSDIDQLCERLGDQAVRYDGKVTPDEAHWAKKQFQEGKAKYFVANAQKGATGLTLTIAKTVIYYSNNFSLELRLQSEDRAHRIGTDSPVNYVDVIAPGTVDERIVDSLKSKYDIFHNINGDVLQEWI